MRSLVSLIRETQRVFAAAGKLAAARKKAAPLTSAFADAWRRRERKLRDLK
jgi:hypothetical protein